MRTLSDTVGVFGAPGQARGIDKQVWNSDVFTERFMPMLQGQPFDSHV